MPICPDSFIDPTNIMMSLNLTAASHVHLMEPQWNPMVEAQALDRVHRLGQKNPVTTFRYIAKSTFDEVIFWALSRLSPRMCTDGRYCSRFSSCRTKSLKWPNSPSALMNIAKPKECSKDYWYIQFSLGPPFRVEISMTDV